VTLVRWRAVNGVSKMISVLAGLVFATQASAQARSRDCHAGLFGGAVFMQSRHVNSNGGDITDRFDVNGRNAGAFLGCDWHRGTSFIGVEADLAGVDASGTARDLTNVGPTVTSGTRLDRLATLRARLGYAPRVPWALYGTVGVGVGWAQASIAADNGASFTDRQKLYGIAVGGGAEYRLARAISAKLEYLYFAFEQKAFFDPAPAGFADRGGGIDPEVHVVRLGINVHF
jgi:outer membrane immunogenic protein